MPHADAAVTGRQPGRLAEVPATGALAVEHQPRAVAAEAEVLGERQLLLEGRERARAFKAEDAVLGGDVVGVGDQRRVGRVGDHQLDLVVLGIVEDERLRLRRIEAQHLRVRLVGDQPVHPELERVIRGDAQDHALDVAVARHARLGLVELEEGDDAAGVSLLVAEVGVVAERRLEVERVLDEPQPHDLAPEVDVGRHVARDAREVVRSFERLLHAFSSLAVIGICTFPPSMSILRAMTVAAPTTIAGQVATRLRAEIVAGEREPGSKLRQVEIAKRYGVSTTPVREALAMLQREGLVRLHAQRGAVVFLPSVADLREHYEIRGALEALAASRTAAVFEPDWAQPLRRDARRDARRPARGALHRAQPALPHDALRPLRPRAAGGDDRRAARRVVRLPAHLPRGRRLPDRAAGRRAPRDPRRVPRPRP